MQREEKQKANRLVIYMIKPEFQSAENILDEGVSDPISIDDIGQFYFQESHPHRPNWVTDFFGNSLAELRILSASAKGLLLVPIETDQGVVHFVITFGSGRFLLKEGVIEERFGLKVVLNSIDQEQRQLRSIDKTSLGSIPKHSREQMSRDVEATEFGIDIEQDLVSAVTARSADKKFGRTISGRDALSASVPVDAHDIKDFLAHCYTRYRSEDYKKAFDWIDQISEVRNKKLEASLNGELVARLQRGDLGKIWMAVPDVVTWADGKGFRYQRAKRGVLHDDLDATTFLHEVIKEGITLEKLQHSLVYFISAKDDEVIQKWSALRCFYAEVEQEDKLYVLNNGKWYEVAHGFTDQVHRDYASVLDASRQSTLELPQCEITDENEYNRGVADAITSIACLDRQLIAHGGGRSTIEFCDLYSTHRQMIHVKRYGGSSVLSHLFNQGVISGELFVSDANFRHAVNKILPDGAKLVSTDDRPNASDYEVVYAVISNAAEDLDIPFFSKVSLRNARRRLQGYGYRVTLKKIQRTTPADVKEV